MDRGWREFYQSVVRKNPWKKRKAKRMENCRCRDYTINDLSLNSGVWAYSDREWREQCVRVLQGAMKVVVGPLQKCGLAVFLYKARKPVEWNCMPLLGCRAVVFQQPRICQLCVTVSR